jgi:hypothetical protein
MVCSSTEKEKKVKSLLTGSFYKTKTFPRKPPMDFCSVLGGQNWVTWPSLPLKESGKEKRKVGLFLIAYINAFQNTLCKPCI